MFNVTLPIRAESADASPSSPAAGNSARSQGLSPPSHPDVCGAEQAAGPEALCRPRQVAVFLKALASPFVTPRSFSEAPPQPSSTQPCSGGSDALLSLFPHLRNCSVILVLRAENEGRREVTQKTSININSERALQTVVCCVHVRGIVDEEAGLGLRDPILIPFGCWAAGLVEFLSVIY